MHKLEYVLENETHKVFWEFEIKIDHQIPARRPDQVIVKKEKQPNSGLKSKKTKRDIST